MLGEEDELYVGHPGGMGDRGANLILQSADVLLSIGSRLDTSLTAFNEPHFGMSAKKIVVDIDQHELDRMKLEQVAAMQACDAGDYIRSLYHAVVADEKIREQSAQRKTGSSQCLLFHRTVMQAYNKRGCYRTGELRGGRRNHISGIFSKAWSKNEKCCGTWLYGLWITLFHRSLSGQ